jgi:hypothetical protein
MIENCLITRSRSTFICLSYIYFFSALRNKKYFFLIKMLSSEELEKYIESVNLELFKLKDEIFKMKIRMREAIRDYLNILDELEAIMEAG